MDYKLSKKIRGALAVFVKTPEYSLVKTRLASSIGSEQAIKFYQLSVQATAATLRELKKKFPHLEIFWAIAEPEAISNNQWSEFPNILQGDGGLGDRLSTVYDLLMKDHDYVCFIGADSPHLSLGSFERAIELTEENLTKKFIIGETDDGGFYFFGGSRSLPKSIWLNVQYSTSCTAEQLLEGLRLRGEVEHLVKDFDIDTVADLQRLSSSMFENFSAEAHILNSSQIELLNWVRSISNL